MPRLLTLRDVTAVTALSRSAIYALMAESRFPKPIRIGTRAVRWVEQEVLDSSPAVLEPARSGPRAAKDDTAIHATGSRGPGRVEERASTRGRNRLMVRW